MKKELRLVLLLAFLFCSAVALADNQGARQSGRTANSSGSSGLAVGSTAVTGGSTTKIEYNNAGTLGEYTVSGSGSVCMTTSCSMTTPALGTPASGTLTNCTGLPVAGGGTGAATLTGIVVGNGTSAMTTVTAPSGTIVGTTDTQTFTNKRNTPRVISITSSATPTINTDNADNVTITALAAAITSFTTNLTGTPNNFDRLTIRIKDDGAGPYAITWGASFTAEGVSLPTTTTTSKVLTVGFIWDSVKAKWGCVSSATEA